MVGLYATTCLLLLVHRVENYFIELNENKKIKINVKVSSWRWLNQRADTPDTTQPYWYQNLRYFELLFYQITRIIIYAFGLVCYCKSTRLECFEIIYAFCQHQNKVYIILIYFIACHSFGLRSNDFKLKKIFFSFKFLYLTRCRLYEWKVLFKSKN